MVAFCPGGLLSWVGIFSGLLSGGLLSVRQTYIHEIRGYSFEFHVTIVNDLFCPVL